MERSMSIILSLLSLASFTPAALDCPLGTQLQLRQTRDRRLASWASTGESSLRYVETRTIRPVSVRCTVSLNAFHPNSSGARTQSGHYIWFRNWSLPVSIVSSPVFGTSSGEARPTISLDTARTCNQAAIASTTFGPFSSCISLTRGRSGATLEITSRAPKSKTPRMTVSLPYRLSYSGISAGDWAHDIGGEIALIRAEDDGSTVVDIYTLLAS